MKKNLLLFVIVGLVLFGGCSEKIEIPTQPDYQYSARSFENEDYYSGYKYITITINDMCNVKSICEDDAVTNENGNTTQSIAEESYAMSTQILISYFRETLIRDGFQLNNKALLKAFLGKIGALEKMIESSDVEGIKNKIMNDLLPFTEKWMSGSSVRTAGWILELVHFMAENGVEGGQICFPQMGPCNGHYLWIGFMWVCCEWWEAEGTINKDGLELKFKIGGTVPQD